MPANTTLPPNCPFCPHEEHDGRECERPLRMEQGVVKPYDTPAFCPCVGPTEDERRELEGPTLLLGWLDTALNATAVDAFSQNGMCVTSCRQLGSTLILGTEEHGTFILEVRKKS